MTPSVIIERAFAELRRSLSSGQRRAAFGILLVLAGSIAANALIDAGAMLHDAFCSMDHGG